MVGSHGVAEQQRQETARRRATLIATGMGTAWISAACVISMMLSGKGRGLALGVEQENYGLLGMMGTGTDVFTGLSVENIGLKKGRSSDENQRNMNFADIDDAKKHWEKAGARGNGLGTIGAPRISKLVLQAAEDCGKDPNCICDFAGQPRRCLFSYCCGTIAHRLGESRGDYTTNVLSRQQVFEDAMQAERLSKWQQLCKPEQDTYGSMCSSEAIPANDIRKHM